MGNKYFRTADAPFLIHVQTVRQNPQGTPPPASRVQELPNPYKHVRLTAGLPRARCALAMIRQATPFVIARLAEQAVAIPCRNYQLRTNLFVFSVCRSAVGDVCERRLWREERAKRSGRIKVIGERALHAMTEPLWAIADCNVVLISTDFGKIGGISINDRTSSIN